MNAVNIVSDSVELNRTVEIDSACRVFQIVLHGKAVPWFVSDVTKDDLDWVLEQLSASDGKSAQVSTQPDMRLCLMSSTNNRHENYAAFLLPSLVVRVCLSEIVTKYTATALDVTKERRQ